MAAMFSDAAEVIFEVDWDSAPLSTAGVWTDESAYVRVNPSIQTRRGRQSELEEFSYGTLTVEVGNSTRRFDPSYSAGPLFGKLLPRKRCRLRLKWSGTTYDAFTGWLTGFPQNYAEGGIDATVTLEAVDSLAVLAEMGLSLDPYLAVTPQPAGFLHTFNGSTWTDVIAGSYTAGHLYGAPLGQDINGSGGNAAPSIYAERTGWESARRSITGAHSISLWFRGTTAAPGSTNFNLFMVGGDQVDPAYGSTYYFGAVTNAGSAFDKPALKIVWYDGGADDELIFGYDAFDGNVHNATITVTGAGVVNAYVDGVLSGSTTMTSVVQWESKYYAVGGWPFLGVGDVDAGSWQIQDIAVWSSALSADNVLAWYNALRSKIIEPTTTRAARYLDNVGWPAAWRDLAPTSGLGCARGECADVQRSGYAHNALNVAAATEQGRYFAAKDGDVTFHGRYHFAEATRGKTVQATVTDDTSGIRYSMTGFDWSDREVNNDVTVNWSDGEQRSTDSASITAYTRQSTTIDTVLSTGAAATDMAAGLVGWRKDIRARTREIVIDARGNSAHWATLLGLEIGDRIRHKITPMGVGSQDVRDLTLEAIEWSISGDQYIVTLYGSPIPDVFILDESLLDVGRLGF